MPEMLPGWKRALQSVGVIDLAIGQPARSLLPMDKLARASAHRFSKFGGWDAQEMLQYSGARGTEEFSAALAKFLSHNYGMPVHAEELMVVNGSSGGLELVCSVFARAGETVLVEEASYFLAFNIFRSHGLNVVPVRSKEGGLCVLALREAITKHAPSMLYLIPTFSNPTGTVMTPELRREVLEACTDGGVLIVADDVYQMLHFGARPPAPINALDGGCASISIGSFSKILCPGMRVGWIHSSADRIHKLASRPFIQSGGGLAPFTTAHLLSMLELGLQQQHLDLPCSEYAARCRALCEALRTHAPSCRFAQPEGGYFVWVTLPEGLTAAALHEHLRDSSAGVAVLPGGRCRVVEAPQADACVRLCYAFYEVDELVEAAKRLGLAISELTRRMRAL